MTCHPSSHLPAEAIRRESEPDDAPVSRMAADARFLDPHDLDEA
jgi:hypothetical protein